MKSEYTTLPDRESVVAGRFYPGTSKDLSSEIKTLSANASQLTKLTLQSDEELLALVSPHAGYVFSGTVAASAFNLLKGSRKIKRVFLIGSSHSTFFDGASVYYEGYYSTPLGKLAIDNEVALKLLEHKKVFSYNKNAHAQEHCLEVQLPFLQDSLEDKSKIVPILLGTHSKETIKKLAEILLPYFGSPENLFVFSTDLSHYPSYNDAFKIDKLTIDSVCSNDPEIFLDQIHENELLQIPNLSTSMCGLTSILTLLFMTHSMSDVVYKPILYQNSGDIALYGDKSRVVGYQSIAILRKTEKPVKGFALNQQEKNSLLSIARNSIKDKLSGSNNTQDTQSIPKSLSENMGAFVSVYVQGELRGCIGRISSEDALFRTVKNMAIASSSSDSRFSPIREDELDNMQIEISVLTPLKRITSPEEIIPGKHGILIKKDFLSGTFLPQVATKTGWSAEEMLCECSERKAGLGKYGWKDAEIYTYEAIVFSENDP